MPFDWGSLAKMGTAVASQYGKQQQGKAQGAAAQANIQQDQDRNAISRYQVEQNAQNQAAQLDLDRQKFGQSSRGTDARQALIGALLGNFSPTAGAASGGLAKGLSTPEAKTSMGELNRRALLAQFEPQGFTGGKLIAPPTLTPLPKAGGNGVMNALAQLAQLAGSGYAAYSAGKKKDDDDGL
jgi:hypothetical protein